MAVSKPPVADVQYVQQSQYLWDRFVKYATYATAGVIALLLVMAATLL